MVWNVQKCKEIFSHLCRTPPKKQSMFGRGGGVKIQNMEKSMFFIFFFFDAFPYYKQSIGNNDFSL